MKKVDKKSAWMKLGALLTAIGLSLVLVHWVRSLISEDLSIAGLDKRIENLNYGEHTSAEFPINSEEVVCYNTPRRSDRNFIASWSYDSTLLEWDVKADLLEWISSPHAESGKRPTKVCFTAFHKERVPRIIRVKIWRTA